MKKARGQMVRGERADPLPPGGIRDRIEPQIKHLREGRERPHEMWV